jgi:septum formation protein
LDAILAKMKNDASWQAKEFIILTSDQVIEVDGVVREKPDTIEIAKSYLKSYTEGKPAICHVGIVVHNSKTGVTLSDNVIAKQFFKPMPEAFYDQLIDDGKGDVMFCAGGFCVEQMEQYEDKREGEIETVQGLPRTRTLELLKEVGFNLP